MASLSDNLSVLSQGISVVSQAVSVLSQATSVSRAALSVRVDTVSQQASVLSQAVSVISAGIGAPQMRRVTGAQVISATAFTKISGLSLTIAANTFYQIEGRILWTTSILTGTAFGFVYPGNNQVSVGSMTMESYLTVLVADINLTSTTFAVGRIAQAQMSTAATANLSVAAGVSGTTLELEIRGLINCTSAGVIELQAKQSATGGGVQILAGSYIQAFKLN